MCEYCDYNSNYNEIFQDGLTGDYYLDIQTSQWDEYSDDYIHDHTSNIRAVRTQASPKDQTWDILP